MSHRTWLRGRTEPQQRLHLCRKKPDPQPLQASVQLSGAQQAISGGVKEEEDVVDAEALGIRQSGALSG